MAGLGSICCAPDFWGQTDRGGRCINYAPEPFFLPKHSLTFAKLQTQTDPVHLGGDLASLQRAPGPPPPGTFFRDALDTCERLIRTPSRVSLVAKGNEHAGLLHFRSDIHLQALVRRGDFAEFA